MALPLLAGIAVGSLAVVAFNNKEEIKEKLSIGAKKVKKGAQTTFEKTKEKLTCKKDEERALKEIENIEEESNNG